MWNLSILYLRSFFKRFLCRSCALILMVPCVVLTADAVKTSNQSSTQTLENLVSEKLKLELEEKSEKTVWQEQRAQLDVMIKLLQTEKKRLDRDVTEFELREKAEEGKREIFAKKIAKRKAILMKIAGFTTKTGKILLSEYKKLPEPLQEKLKAGAQLLQTRINEKSSNENVLERLHTVIAFGHDQQRILSEIHLGKQVVDLGEKERLEVDVLYMGGTIGFYLTPDQKHAGILRRSGCIWKAEPRDEIATEVELALKVKRKEVPPVLVQLPLSLSIKEETQNNE